MYTYLIYLVKVAIYLIAFYMVYSTILSGDTTYGRNRVFILLSLVFSLFFPMIIFDPVKTLNMQFFGKFLSDVFITASSTGNEKINAGFRTGSMFQIVSSIYSIVTSVLIVKLIFDLLNLLFLISRQKNKGSRIIRFHGFNTAAFSAMGYIFINSRLLPEEAAEIIRHEQNHLKRNHFFDITFIELLKAIQWFNPAVYLFDRSLRAIHEYQADQECLSSGMPIVNYQKLILSQVFRSRSFKLSNSFSNPSLIKKRMIMMTKKRTSALAGMKLFLVIPIVGMVFLALSAYTVNTEKKQEQILAVPPPPPPPPPSEQYKNGTPETRNYDTGNLNDEPLVNVEEMPVFPGGDTELLKYIGSHTIYPENAKAKRIQGRVIIRFCITAEGNVNKISVLKGVDPELDAEAARVVKTLPSFQPGRSGGNAVPVWYMVPITFTLK
jgi:TonB family protein